MIVLINSAHPIFHFGLLTLCSEYQDIQLIAVSLDGEELLQKIPEFTPDLILYDIQSFQETVIEAVESILESFPEIKMIVVTDATMDATARNIITLGVAGCISKEDESTEFVEAIRTVYQRGTWVSKTVSNRLHDYPSGKTRIIGTKLSRREKEVLTLISSGLSNKAISEKLSISIRTVQFHVEHIRQKLFVTNRTEAVIRAVCMGIIDVRDLRME